MPKPGKPIPDGQSGVLTYLVVKDAPRMIDFYKKVFGAQEKSRHSAPDGRIMHAHLVIHGSTVFLNEEMLDWGSKLPLTIGGSPVSMWVFVDDADAVHKRAVENGATPKEQMQDMFWGDRWGTFKDPSGHNWHVATHKWDLTPEELKAAQEKSMAEMTAKKSS